MDGQKLSPSVTLTAVGDDIVVQDDRWAFSGGTPRMFDRHVERSVPLYHEGHALIAGAVDFFLTAHGRLIDVGCATGTLLSQLAANPRHRHASFLGVDVEEGMISVARERCRELPNVTVEHQGALETDYTGTDAVVLYYTLQFLRPGIRSSLLSMIYAGLREGGALFLFEKVLLPDARVQEIVSQLYSDYKRGEGFNSEEILSKARSLRAVLEPFSTDENMAMLTSVGFSSVAVVQKHLCFEGYLAVK